MTEKELQDLIADVEAKGLLKAPADFKQSVWEKTKRADVQLILKTQRLSKGMELFFYSLKIGLAAALAVVVLLWTPVDLLTTEDGVRFEDTKERISEKMDQKVNEMAGRLKRFAEAWIKKEE